MSNRETIEPMCAGADGYQEKKYNEEADKGMRRHTLDALVDRMRRLFIVVEAACGGCVCVTRTQVEKKRTGDRRIGFRRARLATKYREACAVLATNLD